MTSGNSKAPHGRVATWHDGLVDNGTSCVQVSVTLGDEPITDEEVVVGLRRDLLEVNGIKALEAISSDTKHDGPAIPKSSSAMGIIGLALSVSPWALKQVATVVKMWLDRQKSRTVTIEIDGEKLELKASKGADQKAALEFFLRRHSPVIEGPPDLTPPDAE
ncbi:hypothetical protein OHT20_18585 [Streptomyces caniferus]|uniref:hypothetical protein n=1 Tax=Streptomyces caniferus TaxID=285557 RepID=UPI002E2A3D18|nr:hypothetical protein [Streptomyces caniferus]